MPNINQKSIKPNEVCDIFIDGFPRKYKKPSKDCFYKILKKNITKADIPLYTISFEVKNKRNEKIEILATQSKSYNEVSKNTKIYKFLNKNGFNKADYAVPYLIGENKEYNYFFREMRNGDVLTSILLDKNKRHDFYIKKAARWLAKLHKINPIKYTNGARLATKTAYYQNIYGTEPRPDNYVRDFLKNLNKNPQGPLIKKISSLFIQLEAPFREKSEGLDNETLCLIHGDFHTEHVFFDKNKNIFVIDFDWASIWHPYWDLGRFCSYLIKYFPEEKKFEFENIFLTEYLKHNKLENNHNRIINNKTFVFAQAATIKDMIIERLISAGHRFSNEKSNSYFPSNIEKRKDPSIKQSIDLVVRFTGFLEDEIKKLKS